MTAKKGYPGLSKRLGRKRRLRRYNRGLSDSIPVPCPAERACHDPGPIVAPFITGKSDPSHIRTRAPLSTPTAPPVLNATEIADLPIKRHRGTARNLTWEQRFAKEAILRAQRVGRMLRRRKLEEEQE